MPRVKRGVTVRKKHKKILNLAKGFRGTRSRHIKNAKEAVLHSLDYSYHARKRKKRDFRKLWIARINAAIRQEGLNYSRFIHLLKSKGVQLNNKIISEIAIRNKTVFDELVKLAKES